MSLHPSSPSSINIDVSKIISLSKSQNPKLTPNQKAFYYHLPFYSSNLQASSSIHLYSLLSYIYFTKRNTSSLLRVITLSLDIINHEDTKETHKHVYLMLLRLIDLLEQTNDNVILAYYFTKLALNYVEHFLNKNAEYTSKLRDIGVKIKTKLKTELNDVKSQRYDILTTDQTAFVSDDKEKFYNSISVLYDTKLNDVSAQQLQDGECVYLVSKRWVMLYRSFLSLLKDIECNADDYKLFLQTFDLKKLFEAFYQCRLENEFDSSSSSTATNAFIGYMGRVNNYWLLNVKENSLIDPDVTKAHENVYINDLHMIHNEYVKLSKEQWEMLIDNFNYTNEIKRVKRNGTLELVLQKIRVIVLDDNIKMNCMELLHERVVQVSQWDTFDELLHKIERCVNAYYNKYKDRNDSYTFNIRADNVEMFYSYEREYSAEIMKLILAFVSDGVNSYIFNCCPLDNNKNGSTIYAQVISNLQFLQSNNNGHGSVNDNCDNCNDVNVNDDNNNDNDDIDSNNNNNSNNYSNSSNKGYPLLIIQTKKFIVPYNNNTNNTASTCAYCNNTIHNNNIVICDKDYCNTSVYVYCSDTCMQKDNSHLHFHTILSSLTHKVTLSTLECLQLESFLSTESHHGLVGLENLGNTCFLNSCLQCLSNCEELTKLFLSNLYKLEINNTNALGTRGEVVTAYHDLLQSLWNSTERSLSPSLFRGIFIQFAKQFSGYAQHDSQEVLTFMLDKLHEDLNKISRKPYFEIKVQEPTETDEQASNRFWKCYLLRENSIIVDLFHGQYKNKVLCPQCKKVSTTYEPFVFLSLPIPSEKIIFKYKYFPLDFQARHEEYELPIARVFSAETLLNDIAKHHKHKQFEVVLFDNTKTLVKVFTRNEDLMSYIHNRNYELCVYQVSEGKENIYCYLTRYSIVNTFFGVIPTEKIEMLTRYPIALSVSAEYKIETIYAKIHSNIVQPIYALSNVFKHKKDETSSLISSFTSLTTHNEHLHGFILHLTSNHYNHATCNPYCDFCGVKIGSNNSHSCLMLSRFTQNEPYKYIKQCCSVVEHPLCVHVELLCELGNTIHILDNRNIQTESGVYHLCKGEIDLYDCLDLFCSEEKLESDNMWYCSSCKQHQEALKKIDIYRAPYYLIIQLKRFKRNQLHQPFYMSYTHSSSKNDKVIRFPINNLNMNKYVIGKPRNDNVNYMYDLYAVSQHYGGASFGHYTAACRNGGKWYCFNDSNVSEITNRDDIVDSGAYLLFYKLKR